MLPYSDNKPKGAGDFYFAINATFRFLQRSFGMDNLVRYWTELGESTYFRPVADDWRARGLPAVAEYWRDFFQAEPNSLVEVACDEKQVRLDVRQCPAIFHLRKSGRSIVPEFCQHCYFVSDAIAARAGLEARVEGGDGTCCQTFAPRDSSAPQNLAAIRRAT